MRATRAGAVVCILRMMRGALVLAVVAVAACSGSVVTESGSSAGDGGGDDARSGCKTCGPSPGAGDATTGSSASSGGGGSSGAGSAEAATHSSSGETSGSSGGGDGAGAGSCGAPGDASSGDGSEPRADAFVAALIGPGVLDGVNDSAACGQGDLSWTLGNPVSPKPVTYADGSSQVGGSVLLSCRVDQDACGFGIRLSAALGGSEGGTLVVSGTVGADGTGRGLSASFSTMGESFVDNDCTFALTYDGGPLPAGALPAQGRIWGHLTCPTAVDPGQVGLGEDGGPIPRTCEASADFLFENCE